MKKSKNPDGLAAEWQKYLSRGGEIRTQKLPFLSINQCDKYFKWTFCVCGSFLRFVISDKITKFNLNIWTAWLSLIKVAVFWWKFNTQLEKDLSTIKTSLKTPSTHTLSHTHTHKICRQSAFIKLLKRTKRNVTLWIHLSPLGHRMVTVQSKCQWWAHESVLEGTESLKSLKSLQSSKI